MADLLDEILARGRFPELRPSGQTMGNIDANEVVPGLWQGSVPPEGGALRRAGFQAVILCAREHQPSGSHFRGIRVFRAPLDDDPKGLTAREIETWLAAASKVALLVRGGSRVLVTCQAGLNRSGIVVAQALKLNGHSAEDAIAAVRRAREWGLCNEAFVKELLASPHPSEHRIVRP